MTRTPVLLLRATRVLLGAHLGSEEELWEEEGLHDEHLHQERQDDDD
jgi:hypothetical protein